MQEGDHDLIDSTGSALNTTKAMALGSVDKGRAFPKLVSFHSRGTAAPRLIGEKKASTVSVQEDDSRILKVRTNGHDKVFCLEDFGLLKD